MPLDVVCPNCRKSGTISGSEAGNALRCRACGTTFSTPNTEQPAQKAQQQSSMAGDINKGFNMAIGAIIAIIAIACVLFALTVLPVVCIAVMEGTSSSYSARATRVTSTPAVSVPATEAPDVAKYPQDYEAIERVYATMKIGRPYQAMSSRTAPLQGGTAVLVAKSGAYWVNNGVVYWVNALADVWSPDIPRSPSGIDKSTIDAALGVFPGQTPH